MRPPHSVGPCRQQHPVSCACAGLVFNLGPVADANPSHARAPPHHSTVLVDTTSAATAAAAASTVVAPHAYATFSPAGDSILYTTAGPSPLSSASLYSTP